MNSTRRPRILVIKPIVPYPPDQGTKIVTFGLVRALQHDFDVTVMARAMSPADLKYAQELELWCSRVVTVLAPNRKSLFHRVAYKIYYQLVSTIRRRSLKSLYDCPGVFVKQAKRLAAEDFDLIIVEYWQLYRMLGVFSADKTVLVTHDIDQLVNREISLLERNLVAKIKAVRRWLLERQEELEAYRSARHIWTLTERDKLYVQRLCRDKCSVDVLPFGLDTEYFAPSGMSRNPGEVLFLGHMGALFNRDALTHFVQRIYPHMDGVEGLSVIIVGGNLPKEVRSFGLRAEVEVLGSVPDVRPYLHRASCLVVPLRFGGGLRIRILEAMAAGIPIVCSPQAIAGMPFRQDVDFLASAKPEGLAGLIGRVLREPDLASRIAVSARERVEELYGIRAQTERIIDLIRRHLTEPHESS